MQIDLPIPFSENVTSGGRRAIIAAMTFGSRFRPRLLLCLLALAAAGAHARPPAKQRVVMQVEVVERERKPVIPCGGIGAQPRDVTARVLAVEEGAFPGDTIRLAWPMCEWSRVEPGDHFRVRIARRPGPEPEPPARYEVLSEKTIPR